VYGKANYRRPVPLPMLRLIRPPPDQFFFLFLMRHLDKTGALLLRLFTVSLVSPSPQLCFSEFPSRMVELEK